MDECTLKWIIKIYFVFVLAFLHYNPMNLLFLFNKFGKIEKSFVLEIYQKKNEEQSWEQNLYTNR